jgi:hypothetical protein
MSDGKSDDGWCVWQTMKRKHLFWTIGLVAVFMTSSCAPATATTAPAVQTATVRPASPASTEEHPEPVPTDAPAVQPVATSRGPNLEATDPATVELASGQLQLVEFFRFT